MGLACCGTGKTFSKLEHWQGSRTYSAIVLDEHFQASQRPFSNVRGRFMLSSLFVLMLSLHRDTFHTLELKFAIYQITVNTASVGNWLE